ncbi:hypothetical protein V866_000286 [Kwoniella sp. B9012]
MRGSWLISLVGRRSEFRSSTYARAGRAPRRARMRSTKFVLGYPHVQPQAGHPGQVESMPDNTAFFQNLVGLSSLLLRGAS